MINRIMPHFGQAMAPMPAAQPAQHPAIPVQAPDTVRFSGYHPDAVIGIDTKIAGVQSYPKETTRLYFKLKNSHKLEAHTNRTEYPLVLLRESHNEHDPNAIAVYTEADHSSVRRKIGHVPAELAKELAPLMDRGHKFEATLQKIQPYKKDGLWFHSLEMRVEYVTQPGKAPSVRARKAVQEAFDRAVEAQRFDRVLGLMAEEMHTLRIPGEKGRLTERIDNDHNEATWYRSGKEVARATIEPGQPTEPEFLDVPEVTDPVKEKIRKRLDKLA